MCTVNLLKRSPRILELWDSASQLKQYGLPFAIIIVKLYLEKR